MKPSERASRELDALIGPSTSRLFCGPLVPYTREDGKTILGPAHQCGWCFHIVSDRNASPRIDHVVDARSIALHAGGCLVADLLRRYLAGEPVYTDFIELVRRIESTEFDPPQ